MTPDASFQRLPTLAAAVAPHLGLAAPETQVLLEWGRGRLAMRLARTRGALAAPEWRSAVEDGANAWLAAFMESSFPGGVELRGFWCAFEVREAREAAADGVLHEVPRIAATLKDVLHAELDPSEWTDSGCRLILSLRHNGLTDPVVLAAPQGFAQMRGLKRPVLRAAEQWEPRLKALFPWSPGLIDFSFSVAVPAPSGHQRIADAAARRGAERR